MTDDVFSLILLPTVACNADCDYCFENKSQKHLTRKQLPTVVHKVMDHLEENHIESLAIYWQGGEVMTLPPDWFEEAQSILSRMAEKRNLRIAHYLQSNLLAYDSSWNRVIGEMFENSVGTSMDFPNLHRRPIGGDPGEYERLWNRKVREALDAGIHVGVIAIPNEKTLELGAKRFYSHFVHDLGISDCQINTPFPGGASNAVKEGFPLQLDPLTHFLLDLAEVWMEQGYHRGVKISPFTQLVDYFLSGHREFACIWRDNCANQFVCIDPAGNVAQCDCWVTSYSDFHYGNIFEAGSLTSLLRESPVRRLMKSRPGRLIQTEDCLECDHLSLCHGGCPVRAYTVHGDLLRKDPYCRLYQQIFRYAKEWGIKALSGGVGGSCTEGRKA